MKSCPFVLLLWTTVNLLIVVALGARVTKMVAQLITNYCSPNQELPMFLTNIVARLPLLYNLTNYMYYVQNSRSNDNACASLQTNLTITTRIKALGDQPYILVTTNSMVFNSKFAFCMKAWTKCVRTKCKQTRKRFIYSIIVIAPTLNKKFQSPLSNMFLKVTPKLNTCMKDQTFKRVEKV